jgi:hypothetical protein
MLEQRLDVIVYRLKMARSIFEARQLITHGHISVQTSVHSPLATLRPQRRGATLVAGVSAEGLRGGAGHIVPVGALISSSADVSLSAFLSRARTVTRRPPVGAGLLAPVGPLRGVAPHGADAKRDHPYGGARPRLISGILIKSAPRHFV